MKIEDLRETAALAHLNLSEEELAASFPAFEQMLGFFAAMQAADEAAGFPPPETPENSGESWSGITRNAASDHFRPDTACRNNPAAGADNQDPIWNLLDNAGDRDGRFIVIPNVL
jgi:aspartyl-tRNA(Asn)/glutamyl-tRNA(Gln) amidotransferase subunit C